jgi:hypothetical protein
VQSNKEPAIWRPANTLQFQDFLDEAFTALASANQAAKQLKLKVENRTLILMI